LKVTQASEIEIFAEGRVFSLHVNPYFLRLQFPGSIIEDDTSGAVYDPSSGSLTVTLSKETTGEHFADLDLLSKLLTPLRADDEPDSQSPSIEVLGTDTSHIENLTSKMSLSELEIAEGTSKWQAHLCDHLTRTCS
jgi:protein SHQ1